MTHSPISGRTLCGLALPALLLALPMAATAATPATVVVGGKAVPFVVSPYIGNDGMVYAPVEAVRVLGASFTLSNRGLTATVTGTNGRQITVPALMTQGHSCIALQRVAPTLGASANYEAGTQTLTLRARLEMVRQDGQALSIYTSYPIYYQVQTIDKPNRAYVDLYGLDLASAPAIVPVVDQGGPSSDITRIRSGQINFNTVRIAIDLRRPITFKVVSGLQSSRIRVALGPGSGGTAVAARPTAPYPVTPAPVFQPTPPPATSAVRITGVSVRPLNSDVTQVAITATGLAKFRWETLNGPDRLAFDLVGAGVDAAVRPNIPGDGTTVKAVRSGIMRSGVAQFGRVVLDLARMTGFKVSSETGADGTVTYLINLLTNTTRTPGPGPVADGGYVPPFDPAAGQVVTPPKAPTGSGLNGLTVVVDPGHGGRDSGALGADGSNEKNIALAIGRKLRDVLTQKGARVYMTRADDTFVGVMGRPAVANAHQADYFISVHCDSSGGQNSRNGTTVYFHGQNQTTRRMALDIVQRIAERSGIPNNGVKSDTIRFVTGFGVLRGSTMPAVLVECGYMNSDSDLAKLKNDGTQQVIAEQIAAGLRDFSADRSARR